MNIRTETIKNREARTVRTLLIAASLLLGQVTTAEAEISVNIGINLGAYPALVLIPGYPVYYDPQADANYFFYGDRYWVYRDDNWYSRGWYNRPWLWTSSYEVPLYVLRVPVGYYRQPPTYFRAWDRDAPPHWGELWGSGWEQRRAGWDHWNHGSSPGPAPLPDYQRRYTRDRYPATLAEQSSIQSGARHSQPQAAPGQNAEPHSYVDARVAPTTAQNRHATPNDQKQPRPPAEKSVQQSAQHAQGELQPQAQPTQNSESQHRPTPENKAHPNEGGQRAEQKGGGDRTGHE